MLIQIRTLGKGRMDSEKERVAKWRAAKKLRRDETREAENKRPFSSLFTVTVTVTVTVEIHARRGSSKSIWLGPPRKGPSL